MGGQAIGGLGLGFVQPGKLGVIVTDKVERPLGFITVGAPSEKVRKVMDAFRAESSKWRNGRANILEASRVKEK